MYYERGLSHDTSWWQYFNPLNCGNGAKFEQHYNTCFCYLYQILKFLRNQLWKCLVIVWLFIRHFPNQTAIRKTLRSLRKEGYTQVEIEHLFKAIVLPKITYALIVYGATQVDLNTIQCFLKRCNKRCYTSELINIYDLTECENRLFTKTKNNINHPLYALLPKVKESSKKLRSQTSQLPRINTERFKNCDFNRIRFQYNLAI